MVYRNLGDTPTVVYLCISFISFHLACMYVLFDGNYRLTRAETYKNVEPARAFLFWSVLSIAASYWVGVLYELHQLGRQTTIRVLTTCEDPLARLHKLGRCSALARRMVTTVYGVGSCAFFAGPLSTSLVLGGAFARGRSLTEVMGVAITVVLASSAVFIFCGGMVYWMGTFKGVEVVLRLEWPSSALEKGQSIYIVKEGKTGLKDNHSSEKQVVDGILAC